MDITQVPNYDKFIKKGGSTKIVSNSFFGPHQVCRIAIIGPVASGKTNLMLDLIFRWMKWQKIIYFCKDAQEDKTLFLVEQMEKHQKQFDIACIKGNKKSYKIFEMFTDLNDLPEFDTINKEGDENFHTIVIINDLVMSDQAKLAEFFLMSRHRKISMIYLSQFYFGMDMNMRNCITDLMIFKFHDFRHVARLHGIVGSRVDLSTFKTLYKEIMIEPHSFMYIDTRTPYLCMHIRKNFNCLYTPKS